MVEAATDPEFTTAWTEPGNRASEIADVCGWRSTTAGGFAHAQYWSNRLNGCVVPRGYGSLWRYNNSPNSWTQVWGEVHQASCGPWGLVATNTSENVFKYNGTPNSWTQIGLAGAEFVVGSSTVYALTPDLSGIYQYSGSGQSWTLIGQNAVNLFAGSYGLFKTDIGSNNVLFRSGANWNQFGGPGASFAVGSNYLAGVPMNHGSVWSIGNFPNWTQIRSSSTGQLVGAGGSSRIITTDAASGDVYVYSTGTTWLRQGGPGYMFALSNERLFGLTPSRGGVFQSSNLTTSNPAWTQVGTGASRLIGGCSNNLYATNSIVLCNEGVTTGGTCATVTVQP